MAGQWKIERDAVISRYYNAFPDGRRQRARGTGPSVRAEDYVAVPLLTNNPYAGVAAGGDCLIWRWRLNGDGIGVFINRKQTLQADRAAYGRSRHLAPDDQLNHFCNRPYCVQPGHLYKGRQDDLDDRSLFATVLDNMGFTLSTFYKGPEESAGDSEEMLFESDRSRSWEYAWDSDPAPAQELKQDFVCPEHRYTVPTSCDGGHQACRICGLSNAERARDERTGIYQLARDLCPVSQAVEPILRKIELMGLASEQWTRTRELMLLRSYHGQGFDSRHYPRICECFGCVSDRRLFRDDLDHHLDDLEWAIVDTCERIRPVLGAALDGARREAALRMFRNRRSHRLAGNQMMQVADHFSGCPNTVTEKEAALVRMEGIIGAGWYIATTQKAIPPFGWSSPTTVLLPLHLRKCSDEIDGIIGRCNNQRCACSDEIGESHLG